LNLDCFATLLGKVAAPVKEFSRFTIISPNPSVLIRSDDEASIFYFSGDFLVERE